MTGGSSRPGPVGFGIPTPVPTRSSAGPASRLTPRHVDRLAALPLTCSIDVTGPGRVGFCHATSRSDNEMVLVDSPVAHLRAAFAAIDGETLLIGHSHMPFDRLCDRRRVVNTGSVGMPYGQ